MSISCINAQDFNESQISDSNLLKDSNDEIQSAHNEDILNDGEGSLSELKELIFSAPTNSEIKLTKNYTFNPLDDEGGYISNEGILINKKITINGQGHTLNFMNKVRAFKITGEQVTLKNLVITNSNYTRTSQTDSNIGMAIKWEGINGTVNNVTFLKNYGDGGVIYLPDNNIKNDYLNVINSIFRENIDLNFCAGIYSKNRGLKINNTEFVGNTVYNCKSGSQCIYININRAYACIIENSTFVHNKVRYCNNNNFGSAIVAELSNSDENSFIMSDCLFFYNDNGGINHLSMATHLCIYGDSLSSNTYAKISNCIFGKEQILKDAYERNFENKITFNITFYEKTRTTYYNSANVEEINVTTISISDLPRNNKYLIYSVYNHPTTLLIYDSEGNIVKTIKNTTNFNGNAIFNYDGLEPGIYNYLWYFDEFPFIYYSSSLVFSVKIPIQFSFNNATWDDYLILNITLPNDLTAGTIKIFRNNVQHRTIQITNTNYGNIEYYIGKWSTPGPYNVTITVESRILTYQETSVSTIVTINKIMPKINITVDKLETGIKIYVKSTNIPSGGKINVTVGERNYIINPTDRITIDPISAGTHEIIAYYAGNNQYAEVTTKLTINITRDANFTVNIVGNKVVVTFSDILTGLILMDFNGNYTSWTTVLNSPIIVPLPEDLPPGTNNFNLNYMGDENHPAVTLTKVFNIDKYTSTLELSASNITVGDNEVIKIILPKSATGSIILDITNHLPVTLTVTDSNILFYEIKNLNFGNYRVNATYSGDTKYKPASNSTFFTVKDDRINSTPSISFDDKNMTLNFPDDANGYVIIDINGTKYYAPVNNGTVNFTMPKNIPPGKYNVTVSYSGDDKYKNVSFTQEMTVDDEKTNPKIDFELKDGELNLTLPEDASGYVIIDINGTKYHVPVENGKANFTIPDNLKPGTYNLTVSYSGDDKYGSAKNSTSISVSDEKTEPALDVKYNNTKLNIQLSDDATGYVVVDINGTKYPLLINNGKCNLTLPKDLKPGTYNVTVDYAGDDKYTSKQNTTQITIDTQEELVIGIDLENGTAKISLPNDATGYAVVEINGTKYHVPIENGKANFTIPDNLKPGTYNLTITYSGDDKYSPTKNSTLITISDEKIKPKLNVELKDNKVNMTLPNDATGYVIVDINGTKYHIPIENGKANFTIPNNLKAGTYNLTITYSGDDKYSPTKNSTLITISDEKIKPKLNVELKDNKVNMTLPNDATGYVIVDINGTKYHIPIENGKANFTIPNNLKPGTYNLTVTYSGDDKYSSAKNSTTFRITDERIEPKLDVKINDTKLDVQLPVDATGYVVVDINGTKYPLLINNGKCNMTLPKDLKPGVYDIVVDYAGDDKYTSKQNTTQITIDAQEDLVIRIDLDDSTAKISLPNDATGYVVAEINGTKYHVPIENGKANFTIPDNLKPETYNLTVTYSGDDKYGSAKNSTLIEILDKKTTVPVNIKNMGDKIKVTLPNDAEGYAVMDINGMEVYKPVVGGSAELEIPTYLPKGNYTVTVTYLGDDKYASGFNLTNITVDGDNEKVATILSFEHVDNNLTVTGVLKDINGNVVKNKNVTYYINNENKGNIVTDNNGLFKLQTVSHSTINVVYDGDHVFKHSNATLVLDSFLDMRNLTKIVSEEYNTYAVDFDLGERGGYFKFRIVDGNGKALANKPVQIGFCGVVYNRVTDSEGYAQLQINLNTPFIFTFAIAFLGDETHNASFVVQQINVAKKTTSISVESKSFKASEKTKKFTVTLKSDKCASIDGNSYLGMGKKITLKVNGKTYTAKTNMRNQATFKLDITKKGNYNAEIRFEGDQRYNAYKTTTKIKIN